MAKNKNKIKQNTPEKLCCVCHPTLKRIGKQGQMQWVKKFKSISIVFLFIFKTEWPSAGGQIPSENPEL